MEIDLTGIHWVSCRRQSGHGARPMEPTGFVHIRDQCRAAGVSFFFNNGRVTKRSKNGRLLDGATYDEFPKPSLHFFGGAAPLVDVLDGVIPSWQAYSRRSDIPGRGLTESRLSMRRRIHIRIVDRDFVVIVFIDARETFDTCSASLCGIPLMRPVAALVAIRFVVVVRRITTSVFPFPVPARVAIPHLPTSAGRCGRPSVE